MNVFKKFTGTFWSANTMELFERWAFYGIYLVLALYLTDPKDKGALEFSQAQKGLLMGLITAILYFLPLFTGAIADRIGYKKSILISQIILSASYAIVGLFTSYTSVFVIFLFIAVGASIFKPVIAAVITKTTSKENSSLGFGIYYMIINIGAFIGPLIASKLRDYSWQYVFISSSIAILVNLIVLFFFFKEPPREEIKEPLGKTIKSILYNSFHVFSDLKLSVLLVIIIGFWTVYFQLFYTIPIFLEQWVDTSAVYNSLFSISTFLAKLFGNNHGSIQPEIIVNIDATCIILFQVLVSYYCGKLKAINGIMLGTITNTIGMFLAVLTGNPWLVMISIAIGAFGEMMTSPRVIEYLGRIAPEDKVAAYIGSSYIPMAFGSFFAGVISGSVYEKLADKYHFMQQTLLTKYHVVTEGLSKVQLEELFLSKTGFNIHEANAYLWNTYNPSKLAYILLFIGLFTALCMAIYNKFVPERKPDHSSSING